MRGGIGQRGSGSTAARSAPAGAIETCGMGTDRLTRRPGQAWIYPHHHDASETKTCSAADAAEEMGQEILQPFPEHDPRRRRRRRPRPRSGPTPPIKRYEHVVDAGLQAEGRGGDEALGVGIEPTGDRGNDGGGEEGRHLARNVSTPMDSP